MKIYRKVKGIPEEEVEESGKEIEKEEEKPENNENIIEKIDLMEENQKSDE